MATASNPFRRKQDAILGIDVSNHTSRPTSQALSRRDTLKSIGGRSVRTIGSIPAGIPHQIPYIPEEDDSTPDSENDSESARFMDIRRETESLMSRTSRNSRGSGDANSYRETMTLSPESEQFDPFNEADMEEDDDEYDSLEDDFSIYAGASSKRIRALRDGSGSGRSSSALGYRSMSHDAASTALPSKAERMLGMSSAQTAARTPSAALRPMTGRSEKASLPSKAQRLLGVRPDTVAKSQRLQQEREQSASMIMNRTGSESDSFRRMLLSSDKNSPYRVGKADSTSDLSSISRGSLLGSMTSRSSREMLSPDPESATWNPSTSTPPHWMGVHPAFRARKQSTEYDGTSPISPQTVFGRDAGYSGKMVVSDFAPSDLKPSEVKHNDSRPQDFRSNTFPMHAVELDAAPPPPVELPVPISDTIPRSLPSILTQHKYSSAPSSPVFANRPVTSKSDDRSNDDMLIPNSSTMRKPSRPSAIFENPNIFEMPADLPPSPTDDDVPSGLPSNHRSVLGNRSGLATPPPSDRNTSPVPPRSPFPPPSRPLPQPPQRRRDSETLAILPAVAFDAGRSRQLSDDVPVSPHSACPKQQFKSKVEQNVAEDVKSDGASRKSNNSSGHSTPVLNNGYAVPSPLAMALAEGRPITTNAPPPVKSFENLTEEQRAARSDKRRVELSDKNPSRSKSTAQMSRVAAEAAAEPRPFSWQSNKTARSMTMESTASGMPPPLPPLALKIPADAIQKATTAASRHSAAFVGTPLTATSARSRASRLEKALEAALSKEGMEKALGGEKIESLFRSAGADELFAPGIGPRVEGLTEEEDDADAREAANRARGLLDDLSDLQKEVDQLRKLYAIGGPLEGESPII